MGTEFRKDPLHRHESSGEYVTVTPLPPESPGVPRDLPSCFPVTGVPRRPTQTPPQTGLDGLVYPPDGSVRCSCGRSDPEHVGVLGTPR